MSRRITRSQTVFLAKPPVFTFPIAGKRNPSKKCGKHLPLVTNGQALNENVKNVVNPASKKPRFSEVKPKQKNESPDSTSEKTYTPSKVKNPPVGKEKSKTPKCKENSILTETLTVKIILEPVDETPVTVNPRIHEIQKRGTALLLNSTSPSGTTKATCSKIPQASSTASRRCLSTSMKESVSPETQPLKIKERRSTIHPLETTTTASIPSASNHNNDNATDARNMKESKKTTGSHLILNSTFFPDTSKATFPNDSQASITPPRRSRRITSRKKTPLPEPQPTKIKERRSTIHPSETTATANTHSATDPDNNTVVRNAKGTKKTTGLQSKRNEIEAVNIVLPNDLKQILVADSIFINVQKKNYEIPFSSNVAEVIGNYVTLQKDDDTVHLTNVSIETLFRGIIEYFDVLISGQLLYDSERAQYEWLLGNYPGKAMSKIYPPIYLLRLLVRLDKLLHYKNIDGETWKYYICSLNKFVSYLAENKSTFF